MQELCCQVCGTKIPAGSVFYRVRTEIISGTDGCLADTDESGDAIIDKALSEAEAFTEQQLMEQVYQEIKVVLCNRCRLVFRDTILAMIKS